MPRDDADVFGDANPAPKNPRWDFEDAVLRADIPGPSHHLLLVLMTRLGSKSLDLGTHTFGTRLLAKITHLNRDTVLKHLDLLEAHGWITRRQGKQGRNEYALSYGEDFWVSKPRRGAPAAKSSETGPNTGATTTGPSLRPTGPSVGATNRPGTDHGTEKEQTGPMPDHDPFDHDSEGSQPKAADQGLVPSGAGKNPRTDQRVALVLGPATSEAAWGVGSVIDYTMRDGTVHRITVTRVHADHTRDGHDRFEGALTDSGRTVRGYHDGPVRVVQSPRNA